MTGRVAGAWPRMSIALIVFLGALALAFARSPGAHAQVICSGSDIIPGVLAKCPTDDSPEDGLPAVAPDVPASQLREPLTFDEQLAAIAGRFPAFGGAFINQKKNTLFIYMKNANGRAVADRTVRAVALALRRLSPLFTGEKTEVLKAEYGFGQLKRWKDRAGELFRTRGVMSLDIEDSANRLDVAVQNDVIRSGVERRLAQLRIPREAVRLQRKGPIVPDNSLRDSHRPLVAGLTITKRPLADGRLPTCTLGFVAWSQRQQRWGFVTNSHCTDRRGGVESTRFYQPSMGRAILSRPGENENDAGTEADDPGYHTCYVWYDCRRSDSAFVAFPSRFANNFGTSYELGGIPDTVFGCCTVAYDENRRGAFIGETHPPEGHGVCKTGQTTGPTCGAITDTCDDSFMQGAYVYRCQFTAAYSRAGGDSGAPVWVGVAPGQAYLVGMHHGSQGGDGSFSPIGNIQRSDELGFLWNCRDFSC